MKQNSGSGSHKLNVLIAAYLFIGGCIGLLLAAYAFIISFHNTTPAFSGLFFILFFSLSSIGGILFYKYNKTYVAIIYSIIQLPFIAIDNLQCYINNGIYFIIGIRNKEVVFFDFVLIKINFLFSYDHKEDNLIGFNIISLLLIGYLLSIRDNDT